jgi:hypothetical protein
MIYICKVERLVIKLPRGRSVTFLEGEKITSLHYRYLTEDQKAMVSRKTGSGGRGKRKRKN